MVWSRLNHSSLNQVAMLGSKVNPLSNLSLRDVILGWGGGEGLKAERKEEEGNEVENDKPTHNSPKK